MDRKNLPRIDTYNFVCIAGIAFTINLKSTGGIENIKNLPTLQKHENDNTSNIMF